MDRGLNIHNANTNLISTADLGGQKLLGMSGSLTNWINTGNAGTLDTFKKTNPIKNEEKKEKEKKKFDVSKIIKIAVAALGITAAGVLLYKNKDKLTTYIKDLADKFKKTPQTNEGTPKTNSLKDFGEKIKNFFKKNADNPIEETTNNITPPPVAPKTDSAETVEEIIEETIEAQAESKPKNDLLGLPAPGKESLRQRVLDAIMGKKAEESSLIKPENLPKTPTKEVVADIPKTTPESRLRLKSPEQPLLLEAPKPRVEYKIPENKAELDIPKTVIMPKKTEQQPLLLEAPKPQLEYKIPKAEPVIGPANAIQKTEIPLETPKKQSSIIMPQEKIEPLSDNELEDIKLLCGYDTATQIENQKFEEAFEQAQKAIDLPAGKALEALEDKPHEPTEEELKEARRIAKELQEKYRAKMAGATYLSSSETLTGANVSPNEVYEVVIPKRIVIGDPSTYPKTNRIRPDSIKLTEPLDQKTIDEVKELCGGLDLLPEDEAICVDDIRPRFDFIEYFKSKNTHPFYERIKAEIRQEKFEDFQSKIKVPKRKKTN